MARPRLEWSQDSYDSPRGSDFLSPSESVRGRIQGSSPLSLHTAAAVSSAPASNSSSHISSHCLSPLTPDRQDSPRHSMNGGPLSCDCAECAAPPSLKQTSLHLHDSTMDPQTSAGAPGPRSLPTQSLDVGLTQQHAQHSDSPFPSISRNCSRGPPAYHKPGQPVHSSTHPTSSKFIPECHSADSNMPRTDIKQMSINSLLSGSDSASTRSFESPPAPPASHHQMPIDATAASRPAMLSSAPPVTTSKYCIHVRQQPVAARSCGFGEGDRRVIDPPPIVQLNIVDPEATPKEIDMRLRSQLTVVHCSIWDETGEQDNSTMPEDYRQQRRLMGTLVSSPFVGRDEYGKEGCFFCFPDLSCRTPGSFRLKFSLVVLKLPGMRAGGSSPILTTTMSSIFTVYSAKDFPGMQASTNLTRCLKKQGCLISIKKGNEKTGTAHSREESEEGGEADDGASSGKSQKVAKLS